MKTKALEELFEELNVLILSATRAKDDEVFLETSPKPELACGGWLVDTVAIRQSVLTKHLNN